eukprot:IDg17827t1
MSKGMGSGMGSGHSEHAGHGLHSVGDGDSNHTMSSGHSAHTPAVASRHGSDHAMSPFLFGDRRDFFVLFSEARISSAGALVAALICSFLFATLATMFSEYSKGVEGRAAKSERRLNGILVFSTFTFAIRVLLHYVAMLLIMGMNIYIIIAVVVGHAAGYFVYRVFIKQQPVSDDAHC